MNDPDIGEFWVIRYEDGTYYARGRSGGWETIENTKDVLGAVRFGNAAHAKSFHDAQGHFYHRAMQAVPVKFAVSFGEAVELPARERSSYEEEGGY